MRSLPIVMLIVVACCLLQVAAAEPPIVAETSGAGAPQLGNVRDQPDAAYQYYLQKRQSAGREVDITEARLRARDQAPGRSS